MKQEMAEFHSVVLWWKLAEIAGQYLHKGKKIYIEWRLQTRSWEAQDWTKRYKTEIIWENMIMLDKSWPSDFVPQNSSNDFSTGAVKKAYTENNSEVNYVLIVNFWIIFSISFF